MAVNENIVIRLMADTSNYTTKMQAASAQAEKLSTAMEKPRTTSEKLEAGFTKVGLATGALAAAVGIAAVKSFADFDAQMSVVQANTGATGDELNKLRDAALDAGQRTVYSASQSADAINELAKAGMSTADILNGGLNGALDLAASDGMAVSDAAELMASTLAQFNLTGKDATKVADALAAGAGKAQGSAHDLGFALSQAGLVAHQYGLSMEETTGTLAAFANAGMIGSDAGTSLKSMLIALANPSTKARQTLSDLGISAWDAQGNFVGLSGLAGQLQDKMSGLTDQQRQQAMATIFGSDAVRAAGVLYQQGADGVDEWKKTVSDSGFASEQAAARTNNLKGDIEQFTGSIETMLIKIGGGANGPLRSMVQGATDLVTAFSSLDPKIQQTTVLVGLAFGAGAGLHKMFGNLQDSSSAFGRSMGLAFDPVQRIQGAWQGFSAAVQQAQTPLGTFVAGVDGTVTPLDKATRSTNAMRSAGEGVMSLFGGPFGLALTAATAIVAAFASKAGQFASGVEQYATALNDAKDAAEKMESVQSVLKERMLNNDNAASVRDGLKAMGMTYDDLSDAMTGTNEEYDDFQDKLQEVLTASDNANQSGDESARISGDQYQAISKLIDISKDNRREIKAASDGDKARSDVLKGSTDETKKSTDATAENTAATNDNAEATLKAADSKDILSKYFGATNKGIGDQAALLGEMIDAWKTYYGFATSESDAMVSLHDAFDKANDAITKNGQTLDLNTQHGRDNQSALNDVAKAALDAAEAQARNGKSVDEILPTIDDARQRFVDFAERMGMSKDQANALADQSGLTKDAVNNLAQAVINVPTAHNTTLTANTDDATYKIGLIKEALDRQDGRWLHVYMEYTEQGQHNVLNGTGGTLVKAAGGYISGPGTGTSDSIPARLSNGEYVMTAAAVSRIGVANLDQLNYARYADGGLVRKYQASAPVVVGQVPSKSDRDVTVMMTGAIMVPTSADVKLTGERIGFNAAQAVRGRIRR